MNVLVTGSSGWLGRHLVPLLREAGHRPFGLDVVASDWTDVVANVTDRDALDDVFRRQGFDGVIHAGALHKPDMARYVQQAFIDANVTGTLNLLQAAIEHGVPRFVFTSTTSLMISQKIREERSSEAVWLDEDHAPIEPRNIYGVTKLAAEGLCREHHLEHGLHTIVLRTARFFPEEDDTLNALSGPNLKANELLNRRASVRDMARSHVSALERSGDVKFGLYLVSAPTPFSRTDARQLKEDAASVICARFPEVSDLYQAAGWRLPESISRVYDGSRITRALGFRYETTFEAVLAALREGRPSPIEHDASYSSPLWQSA
ncbi:MAG: NAD(P)-dependent oxidoreductase [Pseudomonadota bacterium]